jgi:hypothetical protein
MYPPGRAQARRTATQTQTVTSDPHPRTADLRGRRPVDDLQADGREEVDAALVECCLSGNWLIHGVSAPCFVVSLLVLRSVAKIEKIIEQMRRSPQSIRFDDLAKVCAAQFGEPRQDGASHKVYKTPWQGDPRVNIQRGKDGNAKAYQVRQVLDAITRLEAEKNQEGDDDA